MVFFVEEILFGGFFEVLEDIKGLEVLPIFLFIFNDFAHVIAFVDERNELFKILFGQFGLRNELEDHFCSRNN